MSWLSLRNYLSSLAKEEGQLGRWKAVGATDERPKDSYPCWIYEHHLDKPEEPSLPADHERQLCCAPREERLKGV